MFFVFRLCATLFAFLFSTVFDTEGSSGDGDGGGGDPDPTPTEGATEQTISRAEHQAELQRVGAKEAREAREAIVNKAKEYGVKDADELLALAAEGHQARQATQTAEERHQAALQAERDARQQAETQAQETEQRYHRALVDTRLTNELIIAGAQPARVRKILKDDDLPRPGVNEQGEVESTEAFVAKAKEEWPELFGKPTPENQIPGSPENTGAGGTSEDAVGNYMNSAYGPRKTDN